jgi:hypothetical protein
LSLKAVWWGKWGMSRVRDLCDRKHCPPYDAPALPYSWLRHHPQPTKPPPTCPVISSSPPSTPDTSPSEDANHTISEDSFAPLSSLAPVRLEALVNLDGATTGRFYWIAEDGLPVKSRVAVTSCSELSAIGSGTLSIVEANPAICIAQSLVAVTSLANPPSPLQSRSND